MPTTLIYPTTRRLATCRACQKSIEFVQVVKSGKVMPFLAPVTPVATHRQETPTGPRELWEVDLATSHFADCPAAARFSKPKPRQGARR